jgi:hypothetical protein
VDCNSSLELAIIAANRSLREVTQVLCRCLSSLTRHLCSVVGLDFNFVVFATSSAMLTLVFQVGMYWDTGLSSQYQKVLGSICLCWSRDMLCRNWIEPKQKARRAIW